MYTNIASATSWGYVDISAGLSIYSINALSNPISAVTDRSTDSLLADETICSDWARLDKTLEMPVKSRDGIRALLSGLGAEEDAVTDADDCSEADLSDEVASDADDMEEDAAEEVSFYAYI